MPGFFLGCVVSVFQLRRNRLPPQAGETATVLAYSKIPVLRRSQGACCRRPVISFDLGQNGVVSAGLTLMAVAGLSNGCIELPMLG